MKMKKRLLGESGFEVSEVGMGCWQIGANWGSAIDRETAFAILSESFDQGVTFFDTANVYGDGRSESLIGEFIKAEGIQPRIASKFGRGPVFPDNYSEKSLRESVQGSLSRLGVDRLDLLQLHCVPINVLQDGAIFDWLRKLQAEGLIAHFGASVETVEEGLLCMKQEGLLSLQVIFNCFRQKLITELFPGAQANGTGIIVRLPLASGLLTGKFTQATTFRDDDHRNFNRDGAQFNVGETFAGLPFEKGVELADELKAYVPENMSMVQFALRWILDHEAVSTIIPGASSPSQAHGNASASNLEALPEELHRQIREFYTAEVHEHIRGAY
tara:strand:- start:3044 stop:4030 length:987 start_codon:yes stop_codon:yes gene_type:complete